MRRHKISQWRAAMKNGQEVQFITYQLFSPVMEREISLLRVICLFYISAELYYVFWQLDMFRGRKRHPETCKIEGDKHLNCMRESIKCRPIFFSGEELKL
jgi:hypothetical protein